MAQHGVPARNAAMPLLEPRADILVGMRHPAHLTRSRGGLATVEALAALVVLAVGVIAFGGVATVAMRGGDDGELRRRASASARRVIDSLLATPCSRIASGADSTVAAAVRWTVDDSVTVKVLHVALRFDLRGATRQQDYQSAVPCR